MQRLATALVALTLLRVGCGGSGGSSGSGDTSSSSGMSTCLNDWGCVGGSCECTTEGAEGTSCCDPDDCGVDDSNNCDDVCTLCN